MKAWQTELLILFSTYNHNLEWSEDEGEIKFCIRCSDFFYWGCSDAEDITEETFPILKEAIEDCKKLTDRDYLAFSVGCELYCARVRKLRPQGAAYTAIPEEFWNLFHACGEERETGLGNPHIPGGYKRRKAYPPATPEHNEKIARAALETGFAQGYSREGFGSKQEYEEYVEMKLSGFLQSPEYKELVGE